MTAFAMLLGASEMRSMFGPRSPAPAPTRQVRQNGLSRSICLSELAESEPVYLTLVPQRLPHGVEPMYCAEAFTFWVRSSIGWIASTKLVGKPGAAPKPSPQVIGSGRGPGRG